MPAAPVMVLVRGREQNDCAIATLATYLGVTYEDALRAVVQVDPDWMGKEGLQTEEIQLASRFLGTRLWFRKEVDLETDEGILVLEDHVVVLKNGLVLDPDGSIWEADDYVGLYPAKVEGLLHAGEG